MANSALNLISGARVAPVPSTAASDSTPTYRGMQLETRRKRVFFAREEKTPPSDVGAGTVTEKMRTDNECAADSSDPSPILRLAAVMRATGLSRSSIYAGMKRGEFPPQRKLFKRSVGWRQSDINAWLSSRKRPQ